VQGSSNSQGRRFVNQRDDDLLGARTDGSRRNHQPRENQRRRYHGRDQESCGSSHGSTAFRRLSDRISSLLPARDASAATSVEHGACAPATAEAARPALGTAPQSWPKGLRDRFEGDPKVTGPLMEDYRYLASRIAEVLSART
jgi:hypothetical protein